MPVRNSSDPGRGPADETPQLVIVSGMSGSGKSVALNTFEDMGYYCTDNLPAPLLPDFIRGFTGTEDSPAKLAVGIDVRNQSMDLAALPHWLSEVGAQGRETHLVFFDASEEALLKRFADTRRRHPLSQLGPLSLRDALALERQVVKPLRQLADTVIDTTELNVHQLRRRIITEMRLGASNSPLLLIESFAYRHGIPINADFLFDARVLPNPHWDPALRPLSGRDSAVRDYFRDQSDVVLYLKQVSGFLDTWLPRLRNETRSYITVGIGCSGGRHRSVYLAERLAEHFLAQDWPEVAVQHRELD
ncbi:MAG: RNase adapter RapZ [Pseudoxanthomonas suwonensis]|nr:RNase adapter RapZ [Pseudoxanthomonas suwonensis]